MMKPATLILFMLLSLPSPGQEIEISRLKKHIYYLADDKMKGRGTGSRQAEKAANYVRKAFKSYDLKPLGTEGYYQGFEAKGPAET